MRPLLFGQQAGEFASFLLALGYFRLTLNPQMSDVKSTASQRIAVIQSQLVDHASSKHYVDGAAFTNWSNEAGKCHPARHVFPETTSEVAQIVRQAHASGTAIRVAGAGASPNDMAFTSSTMIHTTRMRRIVRVDPVHKVITCQPGVTIREASYALERHRLALPVYPSVDWTTLGGVVATASHGTGISVGSISAYVTQLVFVSGTGQIITINEMTPLSATVSKLLAATITASSPPPHPFRMLDAAACHMGLLGVCVEMSIACEPLSLVHTISQPVTLSDVQKSWAHKALLSDYYRFWWVPHTDMCYEMIGKKHATAPDDDTLSRVSVVSIGGPQTNIAPSESTAAAATSGSRQSVVAAAVSRPTGTAAMMNSRHVPLVTRVQDSANVLAQVVRREPHRVTQSQEEWEAQRAGLAATVARNLRGPWLRHSVMECLLYKATYVPRLLPAINSLYQKLFLSQPEEFYGTPREALTFDVLFKQHAMEMAVDADAMPAVMDALKTMIERESLYVHFTVEVRFSKSDKVWMSPAFDWVATRRARRTRTAPLLVAPSPTSQGTTTAASLGARLSASAFAQHSVKLAPSAESPQPRSSTAWIGLVMFKPYGVSDPMWEKYYRAFESLVTGKFGGRHHWSKYNTWTEAETAQAYPMLPAFDAMRREMDPKGLFVNDWARRWLPK